MNDQELLTYAAKAAGIEIWPHGNRKISKDLIFATKNGNWNPLTNNADAFQLMCKLKIDLLFGNGDVEASYSTHKGFFHEVFLEFYADEQIKMTAARKVIVLAAAEIGKGM